MTIIIKSTTITNDNKAISITAITQLQDKHNYNTNYENNYYFHEKHNYSNHDKYNY